MDLGARGNKPEPGASEFDKAMHRLFTALSDPDIVWGSTFGAVHARCGNPLQSLYCEERLCVIRCPYCNVIALAKGGSPRQAAMRVFGSGEEDDGR